VPLFVEELTNIVLESGLIDRAGDHQSMTLLAIPSTLQDSLMARLDRLASVKDVAQVGACIGRVFNYRLLTSVTGTHSVKLMADLQQLEESGLVSRSGSGQEATYTFKHALVQDAAYQSLLKSRRQRIHASIASALEAQFPEFADNEPETIAFHCTEGGQAYRAGTYWLKAGQLALKRSANIEAVAHLRKGLEVIQGLPPTEICSRQAIHLQTAMGVALMTARGWGAPEVLNAFASARLLSEKLGDLEELFVAVRGEASYHMISGHFREADDLGRRCLQNRGKQGR
jgi:predicted ATPase